MRSIPALLAGQLCNLIMKSQNFCDALARSLDRTFIAFHHLQGLKFLTVASQNIGFGKSSSSQILKAAICGAKCFRPVASNQLSMPISCSLVKQSPSENVLKPLIYNSNVIIYDAVL
jgi:hypothetical protein